ncbi:hypothetical protein [Sorangium sp. So ce1182]|uniref:hypothetical protein n=1 Tax=Sorangium sp. So ce1182 TaxID=3133334 RepID=UPI003F5F5940
MAGTIGDELKRLIRKGTTQKALAMEWLNLWRKHHPSDGGWSVDTAESRLSQCLSDRIEGVKFFLGDPARRDVTFQVFGVPAGDVERLIRLVDGQLCAERPPRLVVDATRGPQEVSRVHAMFKAIREHLLDGNAAIPTVLILTETQFDFLPHSFNELTRDRLTVQRAQDAQAARALVDELAQQGAFVAAPYPFPDVARWIALRLDDPIAVDPPDCLCLVEQGTALPGLPEVTRPLAKITKEESPPAKLPTADVIALRALMSKLAAGHELKRKEHGEASIWDHDAVVSPARRLSWARQLGIEAAATVQEWAAALPALIAPVPILEGDVWVERARRLASLSGAPAAVVTGEAVVAINIPERERAELAALGKVEVEEILATRRSKLEEMLGDAIAMTEDDLLDDPFLEALASRYATDDVDREYLELARRALLFSAAFRPAPAPSADDWRGALTALLDGTDVEARLRIRVLADAPARGERSYPTFVAPAFPPESPWKRHRGPIADVTIRRGQELVMVGRSSYEEERITVPALTGAPETWCTQLLEQFAWRVDQPSIHGLGPSTLYGGSISEPPWTDRLKAPALSVPALATSRLEIPASHWDGSDREIAFVLAALRSAVARETALQLPGGKLMIHLGNGIFAELHLREDAATRGKTPTASLVQVASQSSLADMDAQGVWRPPALSTRISTHVAVTSGSGGGATEIGVLLPRGVYLAGRGFRADLIFRTSPLFLASAPPSAFVAAAAGARDDDDD